MIFFLIFCFTDQIHCQYWMGSWGIFIQLMTALMSIFDAFMKDCDKILNTCTFNNHQIFNEKPVFRVPSRMQNPRGRVQQISELFVVDLQKWSFDIKLLISECHLFPHIPDRLKEKAIVLVRQPSIFGNGRFFSHHGVRLSRACLPIREYGGGIPLQWGVNELVHPALLKHFDLSGVVWQNSIETVFKQYLSSI